jgi:hypothetical protein
MGTTSRGRQQPLSRAVLYMFHRESLRKYMEWCPSLSDVTARGQATPCLQSASRTTSCTTTRVAFQTSRTTRASRQRSRPHGSVALSLCNTTHPLHTEHTNIFGAFISATTMRPNPRSRRGLALAGRWAGRDGRRPSLTSPAAGAT